MSLLDLLRPMITEEEKRKRKKLVESGIPNPDKAEELLPKTRRSLLAGR